MRKTFGFASSASPVILTKKQKISSPTDYFFMIRCD